MSASSELTAAPREVIGKASKRLGHQGKIPAVLYGRGRAPLALQVERHDFDLFAAHHATGSTLLSLKLEGEKKPINAMIREVQHSPVKGTVTHIDFLEVSMTEKVHATVALHLVNDPAGVKAGGVLTVNVHEVSVEGKPGDLPEVIEQDVSALQVGDALHMGDVAAPKGVTILDDPEIVVASVTTPTIAVEEEVAVEATEPEVIGKASEGE